MSQHPSTDGEKRVLASDIEMLFIRDEKGFLHNHVSKAVHLAHRLMHLCEWHRNKVWDTAS